MAVTRPRDKNTDAGPVLGPVKPGYNPLTPGNVLKRAARLGL